MGASRHSKGKTLKFHNHGRICLINQHCYQNTIPDNECTVSPKVKGEFVRKIIAAQKHWDFQFFKALNIKDKHVLCSFPWIKHGILEKCGLSPLYPSTFKQANFNLYVVMNNIWLVLSVCMG